jgi:hypothetical protein
MLFEPGFSPTTRRFAMKTYPMFEKPLLSYLKPELTERGRKVLRMFKAEAKITEVPSVPPLKNAKQLKKLRQQFDAWLTKKLEVDRKVATLWAPVERALAKLRKRRSSESEVLALLDRILDEVEAGDLQLAKFIHRPMDDSAIYDTGFTLHFYDGWLYLSCCRGRKNGRWHVHIEGPELDDSMLPNSVGRRLNDLSKRVFEEERKKEEKREAAKKRLANVSLRGNKRLPGGQAWRHQPRRHAPSLNGSGK